MDDREIVEGFSRQKMIGAKICQSDLVSDLEPGPVVLAQVVLDGRLFWASAYLRDRWFSVFGSCPCLVGIFAAASIFP